MRILVTGGAGALGSALCPIFQGGGHEVVSTDIDVDHEGVEFLDVRDAEQVFRFVKSVRPDAIMHLAAETDVDRCEVETDHAYMTNAVGTQNVALACQANDIVMVYISTAGVFDGEKTEPYVEFDRPNPINLYGKSKYAGEQFVRRLLHRYFIVRASWMIGGGKKDKKFVAKVIRQIENGSRELRIVTDTRGVPTYTVDFSYGLLKLLETNYYGLYHMGNKGSATRYDIAQKILEFLGRYDVQLEPVSGEAFSLPAPRPRSEVIRNFMLDLRGMNTMRPWEEALKDYLETHFKVRKHTTS